MLLLYAITYPFFVPNLRQENGVLEEYQLASDGVNQARLAGESFLKACHTLHLLKNPFLLQSSILFYFIWVLGL